MASSCCRQRASTTSVAVLLLSAISICSFLPLPAVVARSTTFTSTVGGMEFSTFSFPKFNASLLQLVGNLNFYSNA
jgi:hypothetical protein